MEVQLWAFGCLPTFLVQITLKMRALNHNGFSLPCYRMLTTHVLLMTISSIHFCISCLIWQENIPVNLYSSIYHRFWQQGCEQRQRDVEFKEMLLLPRSLHHGESPILKSQVTVYFTIAKQIYRFLKNCQCGQQQLILLYPSWLEWSKSMFHKVWLQRKIIWTWFLY